jgi:hypothetical protein
LLETESTVHRSAPQGAEIVQVLCARVQKQENERPAGTRLVNTTASDKKTKGPVAAASRTSWARPSNQ